MEAQSEADRIAAEAYACPLSNMTEKKRLYRAAADLGHLRALGWCYEKGVGVDEDVGKAAEYYRRGSETGDARATCNLGLCYGRGRERSRSF
jgi:TPR repeat protein